MPRFRIGFEIYGHVVIEAENADEALKKFDRYDVEDLLEDGPDDMEVLQPALIHDEVKVEG